MPLECASRDWYLAMSSFWNLILGILEGLSCKTRKYLVMHLILTGATGLVGSGVLDAMIKMKEVAKIRILSRQPVAMAEAAKDPRINVIINPDFEKYDPAVLSQLKGAQGCVWALGISQTQVGKE